MIDDSQHSFFAFIDESGSEGDPDKIGGCEFLIVSAVVVRVSNIQFLYDIWDRARWAAGKDARWRWKSFQEIPSDTHKFLIAQLIGAIPIKITGIVAHKPTLRKLGKRNEFGDLYYYLSLLLLERISWICRDAYADAPAGNGTPKIIFSERANLKMDHFKFYARQIRDREFVTSNAVWDHIDLDNIHTRKHHTSDGLKVADFVASSFGRALEYKEFGITDDRFVMQFKRNIYRANARAWRNGLKFFPPECEQELLAQERLRWAKHYLW